MSIIFHAVFEDVLLYRQNDLTGIRYWRKLFKKDIPVCEGGMAYLNQVRSRVLSIVHLLPDAFLVDSSLSGTCTAIFVKFHSYFHFISIDFFFR